MDFEALKWLIFRQAALPKKNYSAAISHKTDELNDRQTTTANTHTQVHAYT